MDKTKASVTAHLYRRWMTFFGCSLLLVGATIRCRAQVDPSTLILNGKTIVSATGNAHLEATLKFNPPRLYDRIKSAYPNLYVMFRDLIGNDRANTEIDRATTKISADDGTQSISFGTNMLGAAVNRNGVWQITLATGETLVTNDGNRVITSLVSAAPTGMIMNGTGVYELPPGAHDIRVDKENHMLTYTLASTSSAKKKSVGEPQINLTLRSHKNVMSALYKMYADADVANGRYWVAKTIIKNTGMAPMRDVKVTYGLGEYADTFTSRPYGVVMPSGAVVDCYYPLFSSKVAQLKTRTPMQLSVKVEYKDAMGKTHTEERSERLALLGINQFQFSNLSEEEKTDSWFDTNNNAPLLAAYVTKIDDPVKQLAGYISEAAGGVAAEGKFDDGIKWLRAAYNTELLNNIVYQTPSSNAVDAGVFAQDIKYPRDVLRAKSGTCIDLAILYATLAESVGMHAYLMLVPGHCFSVINVSGQMIAVENTGLGGGNQRAGFDQMVKYGIQEMQEHFKDGRYYLIDIDAQQGPGHIPNPELPVLESNFLATCGFTRTGVITENRQQNPPPNGGGAKKGDERPDVVNPPTNGAPIGDAVDFNGVWKGDIDGMQLTLMLNQSKDTADGTLVVINNATLRGTFKKALISEDGTIKLHARLTGDGRSYSVDLNGKREGNTIKGNGTVVVRGPLNVPLDNRTVTWVTHFAGTR
jgi:hypothetical protein